MSKCRPAAAGPVSMTLHAIAAARIVVFRLLFMEVSSFWNDDNDTV